MQRKLHKQFSVLFGFHTHGASYKDSLDFVWPAKFPLGCWKLQKSKQTMKASAHINRTWTDKWRRRPNTERHNEVSHIDCNFIFIAAAAKKKKESSIWWAYARTYAPSCTQQKDSLTTRGDGKVFFRFFNGNALFWIPKRISLFRFNARSQHVHYSTHTHPHTRKKEKSSTEKDKQSHLVELVEKNQMNKVLVSIL